MVTIHLGVGPEAGHLGVHHTGDNCANKPEIKKVGFGFILIEGVISYPASRASSLFISSTGFIASHLARSACAEKYDWL